jgi:hypothetical protein
MTKQPDYKKAKAIIDVGSVYIDIDNVNDREEFFQTILNALALADKVTGEPWKLFKTAPKDGRQFYVRESYLIPFKWKPYKPNSQQFKRGIKGRWQQMNEYGGWDNATRTPDEWCDNEEFKAQKEIEDDQR